MLSKRLRRNIDGNFIRRSQAGIIGHISSSTHKNNHRNTNYIPMDELDMDYFNNNNNDSSQVEMREITISDENDNDDSTIDGENRTDINYGCESDNEADLDFIELQETLNNNDIDAYIAIDYYDNEFIEERELYKYSFQYRFSNSGSSQISIYV
jgi:hypothetical protein